VVIVVSCGGVGVDDVGYDVDVDVDVVGCSVRVDVGADCGVTDVV